MKSSYQTPFHTRGSVAIACLMQYNTVPPWTGPYHSRISNRSMVPNEIQQIHGLAMHSNQDLLQTQTITNLSLSFIRPTTKKKRVWSLICSPGSLKSPTYDVSLKKEGLNLRFSSFPRFIWFLSAGTRWRSAAGQGLHNKTGRVFRPYIKVVPERRVVTFARGISSLASFHQSSLV